jgi:hypothetical protein
MKRFLAVVLFLFCSVAFAEISTNGLTDKQKAELALRAAEMKEATKQQDEPKASVAEKAVSANNAALDIATKWGEAGKGLAIGLVAAAKELGIAVNDFANTPIGRITTAIIVWKMIGHSVLSIVLGFILLFIGLPTIWEVYQRVITKSVEYENVPGFMGIIRTKVVRRSRSTDEAYFLKTMAWILASLVTTITAVNLIVAAGV